MKVKLVKPLALGLQLLLDDFFNLGHSLATFPWQPTSCDCDASGSPRSLIVLEPHHSIASEGALATPFNASPSLGQLSADHLNET